MPRIRADEEPIELRTEAILYAAFPRLGYTPWFALAEFVDNSLQSYLTHCSLLQAIHVPSFRLRVAIAISRGRIEIHDNAAGILRAELTRACEIGTPPPDTTGLSEYGAGMKAAACWFSRRWTLSTSALGEPSESRVVFDVPKLTSQHTSGLAISESPYPAGDHYTHLTLDSLNVQPTLRTIGQIKRHLASIYRMFLRDNSIELFVQGEPLIYHPPELLHATRFDNPSGGAVEWRKPVSFSLGGNRHISGWAGILSQPSLSNAGFALFRRNRLIEGSHGNSYRPQRLFRKSDSFIYQRLVGELNTDGFPVSYTKSHLHWGELENDVVHQLHEILDSEPLPLLRQAEGYRVRHVWLRGVIQGKAESLDNESRELILVGYMYSTVAEAQQIYRGFTNSDHGIDGEIELRDDQGRASGRRLYVQLKSGDSHLRRRKRDGAEVFRIRNSRWATYWQQQAYPVMLVIRRSDGEILWMNVSEYLKAKGADGKAVSQIVFKGEPFDVMSILRWRRRVLTS